MKKLSYYLLFGLLLPLLTSCPGSIENVDPPFTSAYEPILMSRKQLEVSVVKKAPMTIANPGKIYKYGNYILINEQYKGVHIINNIDPASPQNIAFIQVPGTLDFAVKDNVLYVDNAIDLVAVNIADMNDIQVSKRIPAAFPKLLPPDKMGTDYDEAAMPKDAIIVGWKLKGSN
jgi:hypothetical protein